MIGVGYKWMFIDNIGGLVEFAYALDDLAKKLIYRDDNPTIENEKV